MSIFPTKILLATDGSREANMAAQTAAGLADRTDSELHIMHVRPRIRPHYPGYYVGPELVEDAERKERERLDREAQRMLDTQAEQVRAARARVTQLHLRSGRPDEEVVALAEELGAGLIVLGSRGRGGLRRALMGSVSDSVVRHAHCPVMVVRGEALRFPTKMLLATDGSDDARLAADTALDLSKALDSELHVVYVEPMPERHGEPVRFAVDLPDEVVRDVEQEARTKLEKLVAEMRKEDGDVSQAHPRAGLPAAEIVALAEELGLGLIVMGSRGLGGIRRALMGSVSDAVVRHAHCPVMVVRQAKKRSAGHEADRLT